MKIGWSNRKVDESKRKSDLVEAQVAFEREIARHGDRIFGLALFNECLQVLYAGQDDVVSTYQKQFRNMITAGIKVTERETALLKQAETDEAGVQLLSQFKFPLCENHTEPAKMVRRADILVECYNRLFPGRPREQAFDDDEIFKLMEEAGRELGAKGETIGG